MSKTRFRSRAQPKHAGAQARAVRDPQRRRRALLALGGSGRLEQGQWPRRRARRGPGGQAQVGEDLRDQRRRLDGGDDGPPILLLGRFNRLKHCWQRRTLSTGDLKERLRPNIARLAIGPLRSFRSAQVPSVRRTQEQVSALRSATSFFNLAFSRSRSFIRFAWLAFRPPYSLRHR